MTSKELKDFYLYLKVTTKGFTQADFAKKMGYSRPRVANLMSQSGDLPLVFAEAVKSTYKDEYEEFRTQYYPNELREAPPHYHVKASTKGIPTLPIRVQGGFSQHFCDPIFWEDLDRAHIPGLPYDGDDYLWAEIEGDSMEYIDERTGLPSGLSEGCWCLFQKVPQEHWRTGLRKFYVHLVITETRFTVKRILQDNPDEIVLSPDNDAYEQERIHLSEVKAIYIFKRKLDWNAPPPRKHEIKV